MLNRRNGPGAGDAAVEERAPDGFKLVTDVLSLKELEDIAANYKRVAGFQVEGLNAKPPIVRCRRRASCRARGDSPVVPAQAGTHSHRYRCGARYCGNRYRSYGWAGGYGSPPARGTTLCPYSPNPCAITLRITFGSASPSSVAIGTQRMPSGARVRTGTVAV